MSEDEDLLTRARARLGAVLRGKYRLDGVLGVGGMASVYAATHRNKKRFAVKMLHPELSLRTDLRDRFLREGYAANSVEHPGTVAVLDDDVAEDGSAFIVMELLDGDTVEAMWEARGRQLPIEMVVSIGLQLLDVLAFAHARGIVHRDIKPANLFVERDGRLKVLDFGIARVRDAATAKATQTGAVFGTPAFMAPEQAAGNSAEVDALTDVWAVGATLFTLLSGRFVHDGASTQAIMIKAATTPARSLAAVAANTPVPLVAVVDRALAFDKAQRWPNVGAMRDGLRDASVAILGRVAMPPPPDVSDPALMKTVESVPGSVAERAAALRLEASTTAAVSSRLVAKPHAARSALRKVSARAAAVSVSAVVGVAAIAAVIVARRHRAADTPVTTAPTPPPTTVSDLPLPESKSAEAVGYYRAGLQALRDGAEVDAYRNFQRAAELDPSMAAAHLRLADLAVGDDTSLARLEFERASQRRGSLNAHERAIFDIDEPIITKTPPDWQESLRRATEATTQFPNDAELHAQRVVPLLQIGRTDEALEETRLACTIDPQFAFAHYVASYLHRDRGEYTAALEELDTCLRLVPTSSRCLEARVESLAVVGDCTRMGADAERLTAIASADPEGYRDRAFFLAWRGAPLETVRAALAQAVAVTDEAHQAERRLEYDQLTALWAGDFEQAETKAREREPRLTSSDLADQAAATWLRIQGLLESGRTRDAGKQATAFLSRLELLTMRLGDWHRDATPQVIRAAETTGAISKVRGDELRTRWLARWHDFEGAAHEHEIEALALLRSVETEDDATASIDKVLGLPPLAGSWTDFGLAKTYLLSRRPADAVPALRRASMRCGGLQDPVDTTRASLMLGEALEATGDNIGACAAYKVVLDRWANAKPHSVTVDDAKKLSAKLRCGG